MAGSHFSKTISAIFELRASYRVSAKNPARTQGRSTLCVILVDTKTTDENNKNFDSNGWTFKLVNWLQ